jgi:valyl-tRNA synthetase
VAEADALITRATGLLGGAFAEKAPPAVVQREREKLAELEARAARLRIRLNELR